MGCEKIYVDNAGHCEIPNMAIRNQVIDSFLKGFLPGFYPHLGDTCEIYDLRLEDSSLDIKSQTP